jgi:hypothetical protein
MAPASDAGTGADDVTATADRQLLASAAWLTPRTVLYGTLGWIGLFAAASVWLANPFFTERSAGAVLVVNDTTS